VTDNVLVKKFVLMIFKKRNFSQNIKDFPPLFQTKNMTKFDLEFISILAVFSNQNVMIWHNLESKMHNNKLV